MRAFKVLVHLLVVLYISSSCKEPKPVPAEIPARDCNVATFTESKRNYSFEYDSNGFPLKVFRIIKGFDPVLDHRFEFLEGELNTIYRVDLEGASFPETKLEYNNGLLRLIRTFEGHRQSVVDTVFEIMERERIEFRYEATDKPAALTHWHADGNGGFLKSHESIFEYNAAGNLTVERRHDYATANMPAADFVYEYFYDDKPNTQKQLNYLFFNAAESPARLFSTNNLNRLAISYNGAVFREQAFKLVYNSKDNVVSDNSRFTDITWTCK